MDVTLVIFSALLLLLEACDGLQNISRYRGYIQWVHNYIRRQEQAADMKYMYYDRNLERRAAELANTCIFRHQKRGYGENLGFISTTGPAVPDIQSINNAMYNWYIERPLWHGGSGHCGAACHFTQMIWARTSRLGCALNHCAVLDDGNGNLHRNAKYFVCFYYPQGNWVGQHAYTRGRPCSRCPAGNYCYQGLCHGPGRRRRRSADKSAVPSFSSIVGISE